MNKNAPVSSIMTANVRTVNPGHSLEDAEKLMRRNRIRHVPVVSGEKVVGILSLTDLMRMSFADTYGDDETMVDTAIYNMLTIEQVMVANPTTIDADATIRETAEVLTQHEFHALPVTRDGKLTGIVTTTDLIRFLLEQL